MGRKPVVDEEREGLLKEAYYSPKKPGSFGGVDKLKRATKLRTDVIKNWLRHQDAYTLHKKIVQRFPRRRVVVGGIDHQWQSDLIDLRSL